MNSRMNQEPIGVRGLLKQHKLFTHEDDIKSFNSQGSFNKVSYGVVYGTHVLIDSGYTE